ncbi:MAG: BamA/TamA family outer membrane protein [Calditrichaeota bacterium]|nr:BamA/TamA family outer membrane protein [Calditrichota bacterium]
MTKTDFRFYLALIIVLIYFSSALGQTASDSFFIKLTFDRVEKPPACFIPHKKLHRPRIGLALSGGGARGFAQIGALKVFEENNIPIDFIVGASMGSIVGGLYAAGYSAAEIEKIAHNAEWRHIMSDKPPRTQLFIGQKQERSKTILQIRFKGLKIDLPKAITPGQRLISMLTNLTIGADFQSDSDFDQLPIPFRAVACDLLSGKKVLLKNGSLAIAMKASSAIPLLFAPVPLNGELLADGGLVNNIPVDEVAKYNVDIILAIDTTSDLNEPDQLNVPWKMADQVTTIMQQEKNRRQRKRADVLIQPKLQNFKSDNFQFADELIQMGEFAARQKISQIKKLILQKELPSKDDKVYSQIKIEKQALPEPVNSLTDSLINSLSLRRLSDVRLCLRKIYETGYFQNIEAKCLERQDTLRVNLLTELNPLFRSVRFSNNIVFPDSILRPLIHSQPEKPINHKRSVADIRDVLKFYRDHGYSFMTISSVVLRHDTLTIRVDEGKISSIDVAGNNRTKNFVIYREFPLKSGDYFNINKIKTGLNNIYSTNLFKTVSIDVNKDENNQARIKINLEEKAFTIFRFSYRYNLERKNKTLIELTEENFLGLSNPLSFQVQYGARDKSLSFKYRSDRILNTFLTNSIYAFLQENDYFVYNNSSVQGEYRQRENGFSISLGQQIERLGIFSIISSVKQVALTPIYGDGFPIANYDIKTIEIRSIVDTQDKYPFPNNGKYYFFQYKLSSATILNSQISYFKLFSSLDFFATALKRNTFHLRTLWGTSDLSTPFFEFFSLGGESSFYGLNERENIGRHLIEGSLEYRYRFPFGFPFDFYVSARYDIGATWKNYVDISSRDFVQGVGAQISVSTPAGPISFALGRSNRGKIVAYFSAGFDF